MIRPKVSIITVTYNAEKFLGVTLNSIFSQTYTDFESIIIDGLSTDNTLSIAQSYSTTIYSEKDKGLYDAMNKSIAKSNGEYIYFLNAGDVFYDNDTLEKVFSNSNHEDFIYGDTIVIDELGNTKPYHKVTPRQSELTIRSFLNGMVICHQSMFFKSEKVVPFQFTKYKIACDLDWTIRSFRNCSSHLDTNIIISKFLDGGVSQNNHWKAVKERFWICVDQFGWVPTIIQQFKIGYQYLQSLI